MRQLATKLLDEAKATPLGVVVKTSSVKRLATLLNTVISEGGDTYRYISVEPSRDNPNTELWIVKRDE